MNELTKVAFDDLERLSDRLYVVCQALLYGDGTDRLHHHRLANEASEVWCDFEMILEKERERQEFVTEEMKKFEQGFSYAGKYAT